jgi:DNA polymerase III delta prime subunit
MTDEELVKRLRKRQEFESIDGYKRIEWKDEDALEAADRIEQLEREQDDLVQAQQSLVETLSKSGRKRKDAEAKLAKAVEALGNIARQKKTEQIEAEGETEFSDFEGAYDMCIDVARAVLAEIEESK